VFILSFLLLLPGCGKNKAVYRAYDEARAAALADPGPAPGSWKPDVKVQLSGKLVDELISVVLAERGEFTEEIKVSAATLKPQVVVESLVVGESEACKTCLAIDMDLSGTLDWSAGVLGSGEVDYTARVALDASFEAKKGPKRWKVFAKPRDVRSVRLSVSGWSGAVKNVAEAPLKKWLDENFVSKIQPIEVAAFGTESIPLRAMRVRPVRKGLAIEMLSSVPNPGRVAVPDAQIKGGFIAWVSSDSVVRYAAAEAFEMGPQDYDIVGEPRGLSVDKQRFVLDLRLWKVGGAGWWRDYSVLGKLGVRKKAIKLLADDVQEGEKSKGAAMADPLYFLGEGIVARKMEEAFAVSLPNIIQQKVGGMATLTRIGGVRGVGDVLEVNGRIEFIEPSSGGRGKSKSKKRPGGKQRP